MSQAKIVVVGAGAVGCFFGGMLARAGQDVTLVARATHVAAIERHGLFMDCLPFQEHVALKATEEASAVANADLILFCVKSPDTGKTIQLIKPFLKPEAIILSLQNGVDNCDRIRELIQNPVYPAVVYVATAMAGPGHLKHHGRGELVIGDWEPQSPRKTQIAIELREIAQLFESSGVPCQCSNDVRYELWYKFLVNCCYNGICAIGQINYGNMVAVQAIRELIDTLSREVLAIAQHQCIQITDQDAKKANDLIAQTMSTQISSTAQDLARHKPTEIEYLNGLIVKQGKEYGIATPANQAVYALVKMIETYNQ